jgi:hypothetical protein
MFIAVHFVAVQKFIFAKKIEKNGSLLNVKNAVTSRQAVKTR